MRAAVLHAPADLRTEEVARPHVIAPGEALVRVMAAGICGSDIDRVMVSGTYRFPTIPGHELAGRVEAVGDDESAIRPGDRVAVAPLIPCGACEACQTGSYSLCDDYDFLGSRSNGGFAEFVKAPVRNLVRLPENVSDEIAATIEPAAIVLHGFRKLDLRLGDAVAVIGCGALGCFAVQFARLAGAAPVIAVDVDPDKLALAAELGADLTVDPREADALASIAAATSGRGAAAAVECAGSDSGRDLAIRAVAKGGSVLLYGSAHGEVRFRGEAFERIVRGELKIIGSWNSYSVPFPGKEWHDIIELHRAGRLIVEPLITHRLSLDEAPAVFARLAERKFGPYRKILFMPNGGS